MGCTVGTVKAATSRGLRRLRELSELSEAAACLADEASGAGIPVGRAAVTSAPRSRACTTGSAS
jgi:hypothetical protein